MQNDLSLVNDKFERAARTAEETEGELDAVERLLRIVNPKLE